MRFFLIVVLAVLLPLQALAHAQLRASDPVEGAVIAEPPAMVVLRFNEPVAPLVLRLIGPDGAATDLAGSVQADSVTVTLPAGLGEGTHLLSWRVASADGHPVGGTLTFHIGAPSAAPPAVMSAGGVAPFAAALRFALTTALVIVTGAAVFGAFVAQPVAGPQSIATTAAAVTLVAGVGLIGVQGLDMLSLAPVALMTAQPWLAGLSASVAVTAALAVLAAGLALGALRRSGRGGRRALALAAWVLASLSFAASGHAAAAPPRLIALPAVTLHALALIFWIGALLPLLAGLRGPAPDTVLRRFSTVAIPMVALLVLSGAALTWLQAGNLAALLESSYGLLLAGKLALVAVLLALAARNRLVLTPALATGRTDAIPRLRRAIRAEVILGIAIIALASGFRLTPPPRALVTSDAPVFAHFHADHAMADIQLSAGAGGQFDLVLGFQTGDFAALTPQEVDVTFARPDAGIEPLRLTATPRADGLWQAGPVTLPLAGDWEVSLRLLITDFDRLTLSGTVTIPD